MKFKTYQTKKEYVQRINKIIEYIQSHLNEDLSLEKLAKMAFFSSSHFHRIFKSMVGETLKDFITRIKMENATRFLTHESDLSITDVALKLGFSSSATFARSFKEFYGISASEFRNERAKKDESLVIKKTVDEHFGIDEKVIKTKKVENAPSHFSHPFLKNFSPGEYNGHHQIWSMIQDHRGVMYFGNTENGIIEFDGFFFRKVENIENITIQSFAKTNTCVYAAGRGDFGSINTVGGSKFKSLAKNKKIQIIKILVQNEKIYFISQNSMGIYHQNKITEIPFEAPVLKVFNVDQKVYFIQDKKGLMLWNDEKLKLVHSLEKVDLKKISLILPQEKTNLLIFTENEGVYKFDKQSLEKFKTQVDAFLKDNMVLCGVVLNNGLYAIGTNKGGVVILDEEGKLKYIINKNNGLRDNTIHDLYVDRQNGLWLALNNGIARIEESNFFTRI